MIEDTMVGGLASAQAATATGDPSHAHHRAERIRRLKWAVLSSVATKPLALLIPVITIPMFIQYLGKEGYGLYESVGSLAMWLSLMNLGLGLGLINKLTACHVSGDRTAARRYVSSLLIALLGIALLGSIAISVASFTIDWTVVFPVDDPALAGQIARAVWMAGLVTLGGIIVSIPPAVYAAYQELHRNNVWDAVSKFATLAACVLVVYTPLGLVGVILAVSGIGVLVRLVNTVTMFGCEKAWLRPKLALFDWTALRVTMSEGICLFALNMAAVAMFQSDRLIIGIVLGPNQVTDYAIVGRCFLMAYGLFYLLLSPLWPAYGEAMRRGDYQWVKRSMRMSILVGFGSVLACGTTMIIFGDRVVNILTRGQQTAVSTPLVAGMTLMFCFRVWADCQSITLNAAGVLVPQIVLLGGNAMLNVLTAVLFASWFGPVGVALAFPATSMLTTAWGYPWLIRRKLPHCAVS